MKLTGELKELVSRASSREEAKELIKKAGIDLTDEELEEAAGGLMGMPIHIDIPEERS